MKVKIQIVNTAMMISMYAATRTLPTVLSLLMGAMLLGSCGITEPDDSPWQNVRDFSWPTTVGDSLVYKRIARDPAVTDTSTLIIEDISIDSRQGYILTDKKENEDLNLRFLPLNDTLLVERDEFGRGAALVAPLAKGNRWVVTPGVDASTTAQYWEAEIIELFSYRKVEGIVYKNVVAVRYSQVNPLGGGNEEQEWIRFYAQGVGEIMTIHNVYPLSDLPNPPPREDDRRMLTPLTAAN